MVMAQIYTMVGEYDQAIDKLEFLLSIPSWSTPKYVRADPIFAPLRGLPRFEEIMAQYDGKSSGT
jgi:hypothetical protein